MSRIAEVAAALRRIAEMLPLALLDKADDNMRDAASLMAEVGQGSSQLNWLIPPLHTHGRRVKSRSYRGKCCRHEPCC
jgi:hypothetical protein